MQNMELPASWRLETAGEDFNLVVPLPCPMSEARCLAVTAASWVREAAGGFARIRWPNHVLLEGQPVCAIQCRATAAGEIVFTFRPDVSVLPVSAEAFRSAVCRAAARDLAGFPENYSTLLAIYCEGCDTVMKHVDVTYRGMPLYGFAFAVDRHGGLMVMTQESRTVVTIYGGEARIVPREGEE